MNIGFKLVIVYFNGIGLFCYGVFDLIFLLSLFEIN